MQLLQKKKKVNDRNFVIILVTAVIITSVIYTNEEHSLYPWIYWFALVSEAKVLPFPFILKAATFLEHSCIQLCETCAMAGLHFKQLK